MALGGLLVLVLILLALDLCVFNRNPHIVSAKEALAWTALWVAMALVFNALLYVMYQHRMLFWGVLGALVLRGIMITTGIAVIQRFSWLIYVFGGLLIVTAVKMLIVRHDSLNPEKNPVGRMIRHLYPVTEV